MIHCIVVMMIVCASFAHAQQRIDVITVSPLQMTAEGSDTIGVLHAMYQDGRIHSVEQLRWDQAEHQWYKQIATNWMPPIRQANPTQYLKGLTPIVAKTLKLDGLEPQDVLELRGSVQAELTPFRMIQMTNSGLYWEGEGISMFNGSTFLTELHGDRFYFLDKKLQEIAWYNAGVQAPFERTVYDRIEDPRHSRETVIISKLKDGELVVHDSEVYFYHEGAIEMATTGVGTDRQDASHVRMYFSGWHQNDTVIRNGRFTGLDYGGNAFDTIRRQKWVDNAWVSDGVTIHEYNGTHGQLSYTFESHREGMQGVVAWGEDSIWYYPNGDFKKRDHYEFNISLEEPYWTAEDRNEYLQDGRISISAYYSNGSLIATSYFNYNDPASVGSRGQEMLLRAYMLDNERLCVEGNASEQFVQVRDLLGRVVAVKLVSSSDNIISLMGQPSGAYVVTSNGLSVKIMKF